MLQLSGKNLRHTHLVATAQVEWQRLAPLVCSVSGWTDRSQLVVLVWNATAELVSQVTALTPGRVSVISLPSYGNVHIRWQRYRIYAHFLEANPSVETILISDALDIAVQHDPFLLVSADDEILVVDERTHYNMSRDNLFWVCCLYDENVTTPTLARRVSSSGTAVGRRMAMVHYLQAMVFEVERLLPMSSAHSWARLPISLSRGFDQGIHNVLLSSHAMTHTGGLSGIRVVRITASLLGHELDVALRRVDYGYTGLGGSCEHTFT